MERLQFKRPISAQMQAKNDGNVDFFAKTNLTVSTLGGNEVHTGERNHVVMPGTTRKIITDWEGSPHLGIFRVKYDVLLEDLDGNAIETRTLERIVVIMPLFLFVVLLVIIMIIAILVVLKIKKNAEIRTARRF
jgi:hypothetical protein